MPKHLSDKVDDIFSFAGRLEVVLSVKHFRPRLFQLRLQDLSFFPSASAKGRNDFVGRLWNLLLKMGRMETYTVRLLVEHGELRRLWELRPSTLRVNFPQRRKKAFAFTGTTGTI
jgi:hypothetical protein